MKATGRSRNTFKIVDLLGELGLSEAAFLRVCREAGVRLGEDQKNLDQNEAGRIRQFLKEQRRREELRRQTIAIPSIVKVQELAKSLEISVGEVLSALLKNGVLANINDDVDFETAAIIASDLGYNVEESVSALESDLLTPEKLEEILKKDDPTLQQPRPPVVTIMGHVDHGKTTLLDTIRETNVAGKEAGGITQAISSYQVVYKDRPITFIDTPGHETFEFMRKRGASLADVAILVVAADDGVKPQTKEALKYAQAAKVPIVVALNKIDKPGANLDRVKSELSELGLTPEDWGGKTPMVPISALKKEGIDALLEVVLLQADVVAPHANPNRLALGSVVESRLDKNVGTLAVILVHTGTLHVGDNIVVGRTSGRVRRLLDFRGKPVQAATPSMPVTLIGLEGVPKAGDILQAVEAKDEARSKADQRRAPIKSLSKNNEDDTRPTMAIVLKAESHGSLEAIEQTIRAMVPDEIRLSIVRAEAGSISDSDILTAQASGAVVYGFGVKIGGMAQKLASKEHVPVKMFDIIYQLSDDVRKELDDRLPMDVVLHDEGRLKVLKVFFSIQRKKIVGGDIAAGNVAVGYKVIVSRKEGKETIKIGEGVITELQREKKAIEKASQGDQVGVTFEGKGKIKEGDVLELYREEKVKRLATHGGSTSQTK